MAKRETSRCILKKGIPSHLAPFCKGVAYATCLGDALHLIVMDKMIKLGMKPYIINAKKMENDE